MVKEQLLTQVEEARTGPLLWLEEAKKALSILITQECIQPSHDASNNGKRPRTCTESGHPEVREYFARSSKVTIMSEQTRKKKRPGVTSGGKCMHAWKRRGSMKISMDVVKAVIFLQGEQSLRIIFPGTQAMRPLDRMPALMSNICTALQVRPAGTIFCFCMKK